MNLFSALKQDKLHNLYHFPHRQNSMLLLRHLAHAALHIEDKKSLYITFLSKPSFVDTEAFEREKYLPDEYEITKDAVYVHCPNGYGKTKLNNNFFERKLKVECTSRNLKTTLKLIDLCKK